MKLIEVPAREVELEDVLGEMGVVRDISYVYRWMQTGNMADIELVAIELATGDKRCTVETADGGRTQPPPTWSGSLLPDALIKVLRP